MNEVFKTQLESAITEMQATVVDFSDDLLEHYNAPLIVFTLNAEEALIIARVANETIARGLKTGKIILKVESG